MTKLGLAMTLVAVLSACGQTPTGPASTDAARTAVSPAATPDHLSTRLSCDSDMRSTGFLDYVRGAKGAPTPLAAAKTHAGDGETTYLVRRQGWGKTAVYVNAAGETKGTAHVMKASPGWLVDQTERCG